VQSNNVGHGGELDDLKVVLRSPQRREKIGGVTCLWCDANNLAPSLHPQVCADDATYPSSEHISLVVQQHRGIVVKPNESAVWPSNGLFGPDDDGATNVSPADSYSRA
jgi:hypothetical protein